MTEASICFYSFSVYFANSLTISSGASWAQLVYPWTIGLGSLSARKIFLA
jgi:hypothetical protein